MSLLDNDRNGLPSGRRFRLDKANGRFLGVCAGMADYFGWDPTLVRIGWALGTVFGFGSLVVVYFAIALIAD